MGTTLGDVYAQLKNIPFPDPVSTETVTLGRIAAGAFTWSAPTASFQVPQLIQVSGKPPTQSPSRPVQPEPVLTQETVTIKAGIAATAAYDLYLAFDIAPASPAVTVTLYDGLIPSGKGPQHGNVVATGTAAAGQTSLKIDLGQYASSVAAQGSRWLVTGWLQLAVAVAGSATTTYDLVVVRPPIINVGVFTIPALPRTIAYAPPLSSVAGGCYSTLQLQSSVTRTLTTSFVDAKSTKQAQAYQLTDFIAKVASVAQEIGGIAGGLGAISSGVKSVTTIIGGGASVIQNGLSLVGNALSTVTSNTTQSLQTTTSSSWSFTTTDTATYPTNPGVGGPGVGDIAIYDLNVRVAYLAYQGQIHMCVLGCDTQAAAHPIADLKSGVAGLDAATVASLLALDPLVGGFQTGEVSQTSNTPSRFVLLPQLTFMDSSSAKSTTKATSWSETKDDSTAVQSSTIKVTDTKPGWLNALFGNNTETTTTLTVTSTSTTDTKSTVTVTDTITYQTANGEDYYIDVYYDRLFQSLLFWDHTKPLPVANHLGVIVARPLGPPVGALAK